MMTPKRVSHWAVTEAIAGRTEHRIHCKGFGS